MLPHRLFLAAWMAVALSCAHATQVDLTVTKGLALRAHWFPAAGEGAHPAIVALHGCGGLYRKKGELSARYQEMAERLNAAGYSVLLPDSLTPRGVRSLCGTRYGERSITVATRVGDAQAALAWLAQQPGVDAQRLGVQGWSNGATTVLGVLEHWRQHPGMEPALAGAAAFYPGCAPLLRRSADLGAVPLLMLLGASDDWTPPAPCEALARAQQQRPGADVNVRVYEDSYHGFDGVEPVRFRADVPNGVDAQGVHQGGNPKARAAALATLDAFWRRVFAPSTQP